MSKWKLFSRKDEVVTTIEMPDGFIPNVLIRAGVWYCLHPSGDYVQTSPYNVEGLDVQVETKD